MLGLVRWEDINSGVNWGVVLLYAAAISLGVEMKETGAAEWVAGSVIMAMNNIGAGSDLGFNLVVSLLTIGVSNTMTAGAAVAVLAPIVLKTAVVAGEDPISAGFVAAISSAFGYLTPAAQPAFTIIYASGYLKGADFFKIGVRMMLLSLLCCFCCQPSIGRCCDERTFFKRSQLSDRQEVAVRKTLQNLRAQRRNRFRVLACIDGSDECRRYGALRGAVLRRQ